MTMGSRCTIAALFKLMTVTGCTACGDSASVPADKPRVDRRSQPRLVPTAPRPGERQVHGPEEYKGVYADGRAICEVSSRRKVADIVGSKSTRPKAIARALARGYKPRLRKQAYDG